MKKYFVVLVILTLPAACLWVLFQCVVSYILANTSDYSLIGQKISASVPYVLMVNHSIVFLILLLILKWCRNQSILKIKFNKMDILLGLGFGLVLFGIQQLLLLPILTQLSLYEFRGGFPGYAYFISATIFASIAEEFIYRAYGMSMLQKLGTNPIISLIITTLFFCLLHYGQGWAGIINAAFLGAGLGFWYLKRKNLFSNIVAHAIFNFMVLLTLSL